MKNQKVTPYSHQRIRRILDKFYGYRLENIHQGYKANRRPNYHEIYRLIRNSDNAVLAERISLYAFRCLFTDEGYPLHDEDDRNIDAEIFLEIINQQQIEKKWKGVESIGTEKSGINCK